MKIGQEFFQRDVHTFLRSILTSTQELKPQVTLLVYPNPTFDIVNIQTASTKFHIQIKDINGKIIKDAYNDRTFETNSFPKCVYLIQLNDFDSGIVSYGKFVKQ